MPPSLERDFITGLSSRPFFWSDFMFERLISLYGKEVFDKLQKTKILIVGIGGVGGYALEATTRSGIGEIHIIDRDVVELSNLNRQIISNQNNIGEKKVEVAKKRMLDINPNLIIKTFDINLDASNIDDILTSKYDYIIDACDTIDTKLLLIEKRKQHGYKLISSMGTANKTNPTAFSIINLEKTSNDPIARILRRKIKDLKINDKVWVVSSSEAPKKTGCLATNSYIPGISGLLCANYVINDITK
jgi:tRNA A37 threonylcarbamoyladenosine dehydratase